jgi:hypothetical protein
MKATGFRLTDVDGMWQQTLPQGTMVRKKHRIRGRVNLEQETGHGVEKKCFSL